MQKNEILIRFANIEDRFDGKNNSQTYYLDLNAFAMEYYLEANAHLMYTKEDLNVLKHIKLNITEMNLAGSISLE